MIHENPRYLCSIPRNTGGDSGHNSVAEDSPTFINSPLKSRRQNQSSYCNRLRNPLTVGLA